MGKSLSEQGNRLTRISGAAYVGSLAKLPHCTGLNPTRINAHSVSRYRHRRNPLMISECVNENETERVMKLREK